MSAQEHRRTAADDQAAQWIARLGTRSISLDTVHEFAEWRKDPANAQAYRRAEQLWSKSGDLSADPDIQAALDMARQRRPERRGAKLIAVGLATALAASMAAGVFLWQSRGVYETGVGEQRTVELADGSRVQLDTNTRLRVRLTGEQRRIELSRGQALFDVAHERGRPFIVSTADASVTAVGTVFEVRSVGDETRVVLVSGAVDVRRLERPEAPQRLIPSEQAAISNGVTQLTTVDLGAATSWTQGELTFIDTPLSEAIAEVNRYLEEPVVLEASGVADTPINGVFRSGDRAAFASAAAHLFGLRVVNGTDGQVRLVGPENNDERT